MTITPAARGLKIFPNGGDTGTFGSESTWQFTDAAAETGSTYPKQYPEDYQANTVSGTPWDDTVIFTLNQKLWFNIRFIWEPIFAVGVTQKRLRTGEIVLISQKPCQMCRVCWDTMDRRTGTPIVETATGLVVLSRVEITSGPESWEMTLYRGNFYLNQSGELEPSIKSCGGGGVD